MRDLYKVFDKLNEQDISFFFQSQKQPTGTKFYNISYECPKGDTHMFHEHDLSVIEKALLIHWGHLIPCTPKFSLPPLPGLPKL